VGNVAGVCHYAQVGMCEHEGEAGTVTDEQEGVIVYWRPMCPYCMELRFRLHRTGLRYTKVDIRKDPDAAAFVRSVADGNETVPTVTVAGRAMVNPSAREVLDAVNAYVPHLSPGGTK
jgi:mycoredoxin